MSEENAKKVFTLATSPVYAADNSVYLAEPILDIRIVDYYGTHERIGQLIVARVRVERKPVELVAVVGALEIQPVDTDVARRRSSIPRRALRSTGFRACTRKRQRRLP